MRDLIYISYSSLDAAFQDELREVLLSDIRLRDLEWDDKKIPIGADWQREIDHHVARARIMIMMVSDTYLAPSCKAWQFEIPQALEAQKNGELTILWIPVRKVEANSTPFAHIHAALPTSPPLDALNDAERETAYQQLKHEILNLLGLDKPHSFDVFLSHNSQDKPAVRKFGEALKKRGLSVWLDEWELIPGRTWQDALEEIITNCSAAIVCVGENGMGPWEDPEMQALLRRFVKEKKQGNVVPVIPVLLPGDSAEVKLPVFLGSFTWVDFRAGMTTDELDRVEWGITGMKPNGRNSRVRPDRASTPNSVKAVSSSKSELHEVRKHEHSGKVLFGLHGIRTHAAWNRALYEVATDDAWQVRTDRWNFGYFSVFQFLMPWARSAKVMWFREAYREESDDKNVLLDEGQHPSIVAHSFGTYILGNALLKYDWLRFNKVVLCGSILPVDFPWDRLIERGQVQAVRNEYGVQDVWSGLVQWFVAGTGPSGQRGFQCTHERLEQEQFDYTHSEYFDKGHMEAKWLPFIGKNVTQITTISTTVQRPKSNRPWATYAFHAIFLLAISVLVWNVAWTPSSGDNSVSIYTSGVLPPPSSDFANAIPSMEEVGFTPLNEKDRVGEDGKPKDEYLNTGIVICNETISSIFLGYHFVPKAWPADEPHEKYAWRVQSGESAIAPGEKFTDKPLTGFGGPVHISVFSVSRHKWTPVKWIDLKIRHRRTLLVTEKDGKFEIEPEIPISRKNLP